MGIVLKPFGGRGAGRNTTLNVDTAVHAHKFESRFIVVPMNGTCGSWPAAQARLLGKMAPLDGGFWKNATLE